MSGKNKKVRWEKVECEWRPRSRTYCFGNARDGERDRERERDRRREYDGRDRRDRRERERHHDSRYVRRDRRYSERSDVRSPRSQVVDTRSYRDVVRGDRRQEKVVVPPREECTSSTAQARSYSEVVKGGKTISSTSSYRSRQSRSNEEARSDRVETVPRSEKQKVTDRLRTHSWTSYSACTRGPEKQQREQVPESVQREQVLESVQREQVPESVRSVSELERRNREVETILKGMFPLIDSACLREVISSSQVIPYNQAQVVQTCMSKVRQKVQEMVGMTLQSAATERAETVSWSSSERRVRFSPEVQIEQRQEFGIKNPLKRSGIVMAAGDKWLNEEDVVVKKPKAPKKSRKPKKPKVTQASGSPRKVTIVLSGAPDENIVLKRPASQDQSEVVVKKVTPEKTIVVTEEPGQQRKSRKLSLCPVCYMKNCSVLVSHFRRHVIGKHLPVSFAVWKEMSPQRRMDSISSFLNSVEDVVGVQSHDELLELVVRNKWFPT